MAIKVASGVVVVQALGLCDPETSVPGTPGPRGKDLLQGTDSSTRGIVMQRLEWSAMGLWCVSGGKCSHSPATFHSSSIWSYAQARVTRVNGLNDVRTERPSKRPRVGELLLTIPNPWPRQRQQIAA
ncbi:hypothetical protein PSPO01_14013 [Paraphaeosphaeria sporulosa]